MLIPLTAIAVAAGMWADAAPPHRNYARMVFLDPHTRSLLADWKERAQEIVSSLRMAVGAYPAHVRLRELVDELTACDGNFRTWWRQHLVTTRTCGQSRLNHPIAGQFRVDWHVLTQVDDSEQGIVLISAPAGTPSHAAIRRLDAWAAKQNLQHGVGARAIDAGSQ
ncbi:MmyB family transcriptional regulator [Nonomuraea sp. 3N208]|uniref:MmyB family transcriptional regulator n=1 Tax=Nonomuraea sp. 3N208 TaxID=3457421 RepID=UPI003FCDA2C8